MQSSPNRESDISTSRPRGCDTLFSRHRGITIFGKNSDRPSGEIQNVIFVPRRTFESGTMLRCTYIEIEQVSETFAVLLSQPSWMWGAEMGMNEFGVCCGNEAVWTKEPCSDTGLLGMDLLRLGLERARTAEECLRTIIDLLERHGQGGNCAEHFDMNYHNSFLICDCSTGFVLETAGKFWVYEKIEGGMSDADPPVSRTISNNLSILSTGAPNVHMREGMLEYAVSRGYCCDDAENDGFQFAPAFSSSWTGPDARELACRHFAQRNAGSMTPGKMAQILRHHHDGGVCMHGSFVSSGSQISVLTQDFHRVFFTAAGPTCCAVFLPFAFDARCQALTTTTVSGRGGTKSESESYWTKHHRATRDRDDDDDDFVKQRMAEIEERCFGDEVCREDEGVSSSSVDSIVRVHNEVVDEFAKLVGMSET